MSALTFISELLLPFEFQKLASWHSYSSFHMYTENFLAYFHVFKLDCTK